MAIDLGKVRRAAEALEALLARENAVLKEQGPRGIEALQEEKNRLTNDYVTAVKEISAARDSLTEEQRAELRRLHTGLRDQGQENRRLLTAARMANQRLIDLTAEVVQREREKHATYTRSGKARGGGYAGASRRKPALKEPVSLSLNTEV